MRFASYMRRVETTYRVTDRLQSGRTVRVPDLEIAPICRLGLGSWKSIAAGEGLAQATCPGDWAAARAIGNQLSVDVTVASVA